MDDKIKLIIDTFGKERVKLDEPLEDYTTLKLGGKAKLFFIAFTTRDVIKMINTCGELKVPFFIFGTGSKIALSDQGLAGVVIKNRTQNIVITGVKGKVSKVGIGVEEAYVEVESGVSVNKLSEFLKAQNLDNAGLVDIPGSIGGNLFFSKTLQSYTKKIKILENGEVEEIEPGDLNIRKHIILSAIFKFHSSLLQ